jgi:hypothetical protein
MHRGVAKLALSSAARLHRLRELYEGAEVVLDAILVNSGMPSRFMAVEIDAHTARRISACYALVAKVLGAGHFPEIGYGIVRSVAIDVIDVEAWPRAGGDEPHDVVDTMMRAVDVYDLIALAIAASGPLARISLVPRLVLSAFPDMPCAPRQNARSYIDIEYLHDRRVVGDFCTRPSTSRYAAGSEAHCIPAACSAGVRYPMRTVTYSEPTCSPVKGS